MTDETGHQKVTRTMLPLAPLARDPMMDSVTDARAAQHAEKVKRVARQLAERQDGRPVSLRKKTVSHQVAKPGDAKYSDEVIDVSDLDEILSIDRERRVCVAEPGVTFVDLVAATLPLGLVPMVVPELETITLGGAVSGCSIEST